MKIFESLRAALKAKSPKAADLLTSVQAARGALASAQARQEELRSRRAEMLTATDAERARYKAALKEAEDACEDAALFVQELEARHGKFEALEAEAARVAAYEAAKAQASSAAELLAREYPELGRRWVELLHQLTTAQAAVSAVNAALPEGRARLDLPESLVRDLPRRPREILNDEIVEEWCYPHNGQRVALDRTAEAIAGIRSTGLGTGILPPLRSVQSPRAEPVVLRRFKRIEFLAAEEAHWGPRLADMEIPGLRFGDQKFWSPRSYPPVNPIDTQAALDAIATGTNLSKEQARTPKVELIPLEAEAPVVPGLEQ